MRFIILAILLFPFSAFAGNQVFNAGLEQATPGYLGSTPLFPAGFKLYKYGTLTQSYVYPAIGYNGSIGLRLNVKNAAPKSGSWFTQTPGYNMSVVAGTWRTYRDWTKCTKTMGLRAVYTRADGSQFAIHYPSYTVGNNLWNKIQYNIQIPPGAVKVAIGRFAYQDSSCIIDNVYFGSVL